MMTSTQLSICVSMLAALGHSTYVYAEVNDLPVEEMAMIYTQKKARIIDTRGGQEFSEKHIPGAQFIGAKGPMATFLPQVLKDKNEALVLVVDAEDSAKTLEIFRQQGYTNILGIWKADFSAWENSQLPTAHILEIPASAITATSAVTAAEQTAELIDVRKVEEFQKGHIEGAINLPLADILADHSYFNPLKSYRIHCQTGYRSLIVSSYLQSQGLEQILNIPTGYIGIKKAQEEK